MAHNISYIVYGNYFETYYSKRGGKSYGALRQFWNPIADNSVYGETNKLKGIIVWE